MRLKPPDTVSLTKIFGPEPAINQKPLHGQRITSQEKPHLTSLAEFILETSYPSRRIIRQTDNSSKYKSEDEF